MCGHFVKEGTNGFVPCHQSLDPIQFFISSEQTYPHIAPLACDLLTKRAPGATFECTFSMSSLIEK